jgi:hypothetical protein
MFLVEQRFPNQMKFRIGIEEANVLEQRGMQKRDLD